MPTPLTPENAQASKTGKPPGTASEDVSAVAAVSDFAFRSQEAHADRRAAGAAGNQHPLIGAAGGDWDRRSGRSVNRAGDGELVGARASDAANALVVVGSGGWPSSRRDGNGRIGHGRRSSRRHKPRRPTVAHGELGGGERAPFPTSIDKSDAGPLTVRIVTPVTWAPPLMLNVPEVPV